jgi:2-polyprenyl-3-methyl-5-hydroxy-6-metoxy-1,4-benzoquinol methylase
MYERLESCPSCNATKFINDSIVVDHSISGESFALVQCEKCKLIFTNPRPSEEEIWKYYRSDHYISHSNKMSSVRDLLYLLVRKYTVKQKVRLVRSFHKNPKLLDYGSGTGHFLKSCIESGISAQGIEPTKETTLDPKSTLFQKVSKNLQELPKGIKYDVITAWHVIEHVHTLQETFKGLVKLLDKAGCLIVALPNFQSYDGLHYGDYWAGYDVPRHLYHFSPATFDRFVKNLNLRLIQTIPMKLDAYYVSMLSEQYMGSKINLIAGLIQGYKSNETATKNGEYSSLIYILQK